MSMHSDDDDDSVGYRKPPRKTRFRKGQSGNPSGRRKSPPKPDELDVIERVLAKRISVNEDGKRRRVSSIEAILMMLKERALKNEPDAIQALVRLQLDIEKRRRAKKADTQAETFQLLMETPAPILRVLTTLDIFEVRIHKEIFAGEEIEKEVYFFRPWITPAVEKHLGRPFTDRERELIRKGHARDW